MNKVFIAGRLAADPQQYMTQTGVVVSRFTVACDDNYYKNSTQFIPCVAWRNQAVFVNTYLKKGDIVVIEGKINRSSYTNKENQLVYSTNVDVSNVKTFGNTTKTNNSQEQNLNNDSLMNNEIIDNNNIQELVFEDNSNNDFNKEDFSELDLDWLDETNN